jgi:hypothetical protein
MRLCILAVLIVMETCILICGGGGGGDDDGSWDRFAAQCGQPPLPAEMLDRIYNSAVAAAAARGDDQVAIDDMELSWARYCDPCDPCDPAPAADPSPPAR